VTAGRPLPRSEYGAKVVFAGRCCAPRRPGTSGHQMVGGPPAGAVAAAAPRMRRCSS